MIPLSDSQRALIRTFLPLVVIAVLLVVFYSINPRFLSTPNILNLLRQSAVLLIVSSGLTFVILLGSIDLSIGAIVTFAAVVAALLLKQTDMHAAVALIAGISAATLVGLLNGLLVVVGRIPSFVATLGTMTILGGATVWLTGGRNVLFRDEFMRWVASGKIIGNIPNVALWALLFFVIAAFVGARSHLGRAIIATGAAPTTTMLSGFDVGRIKILAFVLSGLAAGVGGVLMVARTSAGTIRMGEDLLLDGIAAVVIGGTALSGGSGGIHRTIIGVAVIAIVKNGLNIAQVHPYAQTIFTGMIVIFAVALTLDRTRLAFVK
ncbi:ABC transporter permease [Phaeobacter sp. LSS9]|uniref:ABC transporter permease n=1 Tax=unclassified Phaeobacter TaxID=2621772 RepID=UPI000E4BFA61|nr:ABC transporter permease [Phaeobacter sp. LSS9]AXT36253.1 ABC transporter permease [Phaeobacter sp. LSS9]